MIKIEKTEVMGWEAAIRGMRNPMNSWDKSDSQACINSCDDCSNFSVCNNNDNEYFKRFWENGCPGQDFAIGPVDHKLATNLRDAGSDHRKYIRYLEVSVDITAPFYFWKEFKTYRHGRKFGDDDDIFEWDDDMLEYHIETNSCSSMHKIHEKEFTMEDFSCEHLATNDEEGAHCLMHNMAFPDEDPWAWHLFPKNLLLLTITMLNSNRNMFLQTKDKKYWWQMIQLLPSSYNQKRTVKLSYECLIRMYHARKNHRLDEWREFCKWIETLPYSELITTCTDAPTVKTGEWLCVDAVDNGPSKFQCSACGSKYMNHIEHINYCGNCGAHMATPAVKEDNNENNIEV